MNDSISREAVLDEIKARLRASGYGNVFVVSELNKLIEFVKQLPQYQWHCSECGAMKGEK